MTEVEIEVESPAESETPHETAEDIAEAIVEAQEEAQEEAEQEAHVEAAVEASESALEAVSLHEHAEYAPHEHTHAELDVSERLNLLENRVEVIEHGLEDDTEEVEEIEPAHTPPPEPTHKRRGFKRGRR